MDNCIFCKIINGDILSKKVYEDEYCFAFYDINPQMPIHVVIAAKRHVNSILGFDENDKEFLGGIQIAIANIARELNVTENGFRIINNCGKDAMQSVPHLHYHLLAGGQMGDKIV